MSEPTVDKMIEKFKWTMMIGLRPQVDSYVLAYLGIHVDILANKVASAWTQI